jgi:hypothetical protein
MVYKGHVRNGRIELDEGAPLPEGAAVEVAVVSEISPTEGAAKRSLLERLGPFVGSAKGLPDDASVKVDHYLYGHPKR